MTYEKRRYSILWIYKGGHEATPGCVEAWSKREAIEKAWEIARTYQVVPRDVQILCTLEVVATQPTYKETEAQHKIATGFGFAGGIR